MKSIFPAATGSPGARLRHALVGLGVVALLGIAPAGASAAATMDIAAPERAKKGELFTVTASGTADEDGTVNLFRQPESSPCRDTPRAANDGDARPWVRVQGTQVTAGSSYRATGQFQILDPGRYRICGYLSKSFDGPSQAKDDFSPVTVVADSDGDGLFDDEDKCPNETGVDERNGQRTADGCPIRDTDRDGVRNEEDPCPNQAGSNGGCPATSTGGTGGSGGSGGSGGTGGSGGSAMPDADNDQVPDASDQCPTQRTENGQTGGADPAHPGCPKPLFSFFLVQNYDSFRGIKNKNAVIEKRLTTFIITNFGFQRPTGYEFSITLSAASKKATKVSKRKIASTKGTLTGAVGADGARFENLKLPKPSAADRKKLKKYKKKISFKYEFVAVMPNGQKRTLTKSLSLSKDKATPIKHVVYGPTTNDAGEEL